MDSNTFKPENLSLGGAIQEVAIGWNNSEENPVLGSLGARIFAILIKPAARIGDVALHIILGIGKVMVGVSITLPLSFFVAVIKGKDLEDLNAVFQHLTIQQGCLHFGHAALYFFDIFASPIVNLISPDIYRSPKIAALEKRVNELSRLRTNEQEDLQNETLQNKIQEAHKGELAALEQSKNKEIAELLEQKNAERQQAMQDILAIRDKEVEQARKLNYDAPIEELRSQLQQENTSAIEALTQKYEAATAELQEKHAKELEAATAELQEKHAKELEAAAKRAPSKREPLALKNRAIKQEGEIFRLRAELRLAREQLGSKQDQSASTINEWQLKMGKALQRSENEHNQELEALRLTHGQKKQKWKEGLDNLAQVLELVQSAHKEQTDSLCAQFKEKEAALEKKVAALEKIDSVSQEALVEAANQKWEATEKENQELKAKIAALQAQLETPGKADGNASTPDGDETKTGGQPPPFVPPPPPPPLPPPATPSRPFRPGVRRGISPLGESPIGSALPISSSIAEFLSTVGLRKTAKYRSYVWLDRNKFELKDDASFKALSLNPIKLSQNLQKMKEMIIEHTAENEFLKEKLQRYRSLENIDLEELKRDIGQVVKSVLIAKKAEIAKGQIKIETYLPSQQPSSCDDEGSDDDWDEDESELCALETSTLQHEHIVAAKSVEEFLTVLERLIAQKDIQIQDSNLFVQKYATKMELEKKEATKKSEEVNEEIEAANRAKDIAEFQKEELHQKMLAEGRVMLMDKIWGSLKNVERLRVCRELKKDIHSFSIHECTVQEILGQCKFEKGFNDFIEKQADFVPYRPVLSELLAS